MRFSGFFLSFPASGYIARRLRNPRVLLFVMQLAFNITSLHAHGPFDNSSTLVLYQTEMELGTTMGADAAREVLTRAGMSEEEVAEALRVRGPGSVHELPVKLAAGLFELSAEGKPIEARRLDLMTDGLEVLFTMVYPRPDTGELHLTAVYLIEVELLRDGTLVVMDENRNQVGSALLSRTRPSATIPVPRASEGAVSAVADASGPGTPSAVESGLGPQDSPPVNSTDEVAKARDLRPSFGEFLRLGIWHILSGFDHLLFLGALLIGVRKVRPMLAIITCFTVAHSVTLALAALDLVTVSSRLIEPLIAASIIVVCVENFVRKEATRDRYWLAGGFGLIHGFGFASVLRDTGLGGEGTSIVMPLFSFNLGVEVGQLSVAILVVPVLFALRRFPAFARYGSPSLSAVVMAISGYWLLERTVLVW